MTDQKTCPYCHRNLKPVCGQCGEPIKPLSEYAVACCEKLVHINCCKMNESKQLICLEHWATRNNQVSVHVNRSAFDQYLDRRR